MAITLHKKHQIFADYSYRYGELNAYFDFWIPLVQLKGQKSAFHCSKISKFNLKLDRVARI